MLRVILQVIMQGWEEVTAGLGVQLMQPDPQVSVARGTELNIFKLCRSIQL